MHIFHNFFPWQIAYSFPKNSWHWKKLEVCCDHLRLFDLLLLLPPTSFFPSVATSCFPYQTFSLFLCLSHSHSKEEKKNPCSCVFRFFFFFFFLLSRFFALLFLWQEKTSEIPGTSKKGAKRRKKNVYIGLGWRGDLIGKPCWGRRRRRRSRLFLAVSLLLCPKVRIVSQSLFLLSSSPKKRSVSSNCEIEGLTVSRSNPPHTHTRYAEKRNHSVCRSKSVLGCWGKERLCDI